MYLLSIFTSNLAVSNNRIRYNITILHRHRSSLSTYLHIYLSSFFIFISFFSLRRSFSNLVLLFYSFTLSLPFYSKISRFYICRIVYIFSHTFLIFNPYFFLLFLLYFFIFYDDRYYRAKFKMAHWHTHTVFTMYVNGKSSFAQRTYLFIHMLR